MRNLEVDLLLLLFGGKLIERSSNITLEDCDLIHNVTILALVRQVGNNHD